MTVGIPGTGIGGLFYLGAAFLLPVRALLRAGSGRFRTRLGRALGQAGIAAGMVVAIWATGWGLGLLFGPVLHAPGARGFLDTHRGNLLRVAMFVAGYATLSLVFLTVHIAKLVVRRKNAAAGARPEVPTRRAPLLLRAVSGALESDQEQAA